MYGFIDQVRLPNKAAYCNDIPLCFNNREKFTTGR